MKTRSYQRSNCVDRVLGIIVGMACAIALTPAQSPAQTQPAQQTALTVGQTLEKTVGYITVPYRDGSKTLAVTGTCFFVVFPDDRLGKGKGHFYMVTNRHVATAEGADPTSLLPFVYVTVNSLKPGNGQTLQQGPIALGGSMHWYFPADKTVDLAVLPVAPDNTKYDVQELPVSLFATDDVIKSEQIGVGDSVFFIGFFLQFPGRERAEPVYRHGEISMMPLDPIEMSDGRDQKTETPEHLYLADAHAFHGNSGSPLFVQTGGYRNGTLRVGGFPQLLGVVNGFVPERSDMQVTGAATFESSNEPNSGILTFVPAQELKDLLDGPELKKLREDTIAAMHKQ